MTWTFSAISQSAGSEPARGIVAEEEDDAADPFGVVGDPLQVGHDGHDGDEFAQVGGDGGLPRHQINAALSMAYRSWLISLSPSTTARARGEIAGAQGLHGVGDGFVGAGVQEAHGIQQIPHPCCKRLRGISFCPSRGRGGPAPAVA